MTTLPTETITRYVQRDINGRSVAVLGGIAAGLGFGVAETLTVPTEDAVHALLTGLEDVGGASRSGDVHVWTVTASRGRKAYVVVDAIRHATGWAVTVSPSGGCAFVWPTANVNPR